MARVKANLICVAGGVAGAKSAATPAAIEDCPPIQDPLRDRPPPEYDAKSCDHHATIIKPGETATLSPGTYCGGIFVNGGVATLSPGVYVVNNGPVFVGGGGSLKGDGVGIFLTGAASLIMFNYDSHIDLSAPVSGDMAGLIFFQDRNSKFAGYNDIRSNDARRLVGTMYFPNAQLMIEAKNPIADRSEYTIIIASQFELRDGPELVLRADYSASPIPVPAGAGNRANSTVRLTQ